MLCIFCLACKYESDCPTENVSLLIEYIALIIDTISLEGENMTVINVVVVIGCYGGNQQQDMMY